MTYFDAMLRTAFNNSQKINAVLLADSHHFTEPVLSMADKHLIDSFVLIHNNQLVNDSINRIGRVAKGAENKHVWDFVLDKMQGRWLDSFAKQGYKLSSFGQLYKDYWGVFYCNSALSSNHRLENQ